MSPSMPASVVVIGVLLSLLPTTFAFNWNYPLAARQCSPFSVVVNGSDVVFPLKVLLVPVGDSPLPVEVRSVMEIPFPTDSLSLNFTLPYPTNSKFVGLVSDASGYRGTASTWTVLSSTDATCFDATKAATSPFTFSLSPTDVAECHNVRIYWTASSVQGTPSFLSVIPDGAFATIPLGRIEAQTGLGTGFTWQPPIRANTNLIIVGGDTRGMGTGGFISTVVNPGTPGRDATGACPAVTASISSTRSVTKPTTSTSTANILPTGAPLTEDPPSSSNRNVGAIVGGVLGGVAVLATVFFVLHRLLRKKPSPAIMPIMQQSPQPQQYTSVTQTPPYYGTPGAPGSAYSSAPLISPTTPNSPYAMVPSTSPQMTGTGAGAWGVVSQDPLLPPQQLPMQISYTGQSGVTNNSGQMNSAAGFFPPPPGPAPSGVWRGPGTTTTTQMAPGQWNNEMRPNWDGRA